jgi:hypothetical protein
MKGLTYGHAEEWLNDFDVQIGDHRHLHFSGQDTRLMVNLPKQPLRLSGLATSLVQWTSQGSTLMLWLSNWESDPPEPFHLFQAFRAGAGLSDSLIDVPAMSFESSTPSDLMMASNLIFLILAFNWEGYLLAEGDHDHIYLGDECFSFFSSKAQRLKNANQIVNSFDLKVLTNIKQAWS